MHIYESDLRSFKSDFLLASNAEITADGYLRQLRKLAEYTTEAITIRVAKDFLAETQQRSSSVAYTAARAIRAYVKWFANEYGTTDWSTGVPWCIEKDDKPQRTVTRDDLAKVLADCGDTFYGRRDFAMLMVLGSTSLRRGELAAMRWDDIDFDASIISIPKTKTKKHREVNLSREAVRALRRYMTALHAFFERTGRLPEEEPMVWVSRCGVMTPAAITKMVTSRSAAAGVDVTPQSFRRGFAMQWLREGESQAYLEKQAGWRPGSPMVAKYVSAVAQEESIEAARRIFG